MKKIKELSMNLERHSIYGFYDKPLLYSAVDKNTHQYFLINFVDWDEKKETSTWLYVPITLSELNDLEHNLISLKKFYQTFSASAYYVSVENNVTNKYYESSDKSDIKTSWLPDDDVFVC